MGKKSGGPGASKSMRAEYHFDSLPTLSKLKRLSVEGIAIGIFSQIIRFVLQIGSSAILARLLSPKDFGLVAMVAVVTGILGMFNDPGLSVATVQRQTLNHPQVNAMFWLNVAFGSGIALITASIGPLVASLYREPALVGITVTASLAFLFGGISAQHLALLRRNMCFATVAAIEMGALFLGFTVGIILGACGKGYWALVYTQLTTSVATALFAWLWSGWRPSSPSKSTEMRALLAFGGNLTGFNFINYFARNLDNALIGWRWGAPALGLYSKAYQLMMMPVLQIVSPIGNVSIPALSRLQSDPDRFRRFYLKALTAIAYITAPAILWATVAADDLILIVLGPQWIGAAPVFRLLAVCALFQPILSTVGWLYVSLGRTRELAVWGYSACPVLILSFVLGLRWGIQGVAICYSVAVLLLVYPCIWAATRRTSIRTRDVFQALVDPFILGGCVAAVAYISQWLTHECGPLLRLTWSLGSTIMVILGFISLSPSFRREIGYFVSLRTAIPSTLEAVSESD